jgi:hypothetical protein
MERRSMHDDAVMSPNLCSPCTLFSVLRASLGGTKLIFAMDCLLVLHVAVTA